MSKKKKKIEIFKIKIVIRIYFVFLLKFEWYVIEYVLVRVILDLK